MGRWGSHRRYPRGGGLWLAGSHSGHAPARSQSMKGKQYGLAVVPALLLGLVLLAAAPAPAHRAARDPERAAAGGTLPAYALDPRTAGDDEGAEEGASR